MDWQIIIALVIAIPILLFPVVFVWYLNFDSVIAALRNWRKARRASRRRVEAAPAAALEPPAEEER